MLLSFFQTLWSTPGKPVVLFLSYAWGLSCYRLPNQAPTLVHNEQEGRAIPAYAIGFDITLSYGTAVIRYADGSYVPVTKIDATPAYYEVMRRLSLDSSRHLHPPYRFPLEYAWDEPRETWRAFRKKLGLPASYDVGEIAKMMIALRKVTEETLGEKIDVAVVTRPDLAALYDEDMVDALEYAGIRYLETCPDCPVQFELWSGFAGNGLGLCNNFHNTDMCEEEMKHMHRWIVLSVLYTDTALYTHEGFLSHAYLFSKYEDFRIDYKSLDWDLGAASIPDGPDEEQKYWNRVYAHILKLTRAFQSLPIQKVIFQGESAHKDRFIEVVKAVVAELQIEVPEFLEEDPVFVAAKGAAEYGYRRLSGLFEQ